MNLIRIIGTCAWIFIVLALISFAQLSDSHVKDRLDTVLKELPSKLSADPTGWSAQVFLNRERLIIDTIQPYFYSASGALHESSPAREERVKRVEAWLEPYEPSLLALANSAAITSDVPNAAVSLLAFSKPSTTLRDALLAIARDPETNNQKASEAYNAVFMLGLDDGELRQEIMEIINSRDELHTRAHLAKELLQLGSSRWAMVELENLYRQFLSIPFDPENYPKRGGRSQLRAQYDIAIRGLKAFGVLGASFG